MRSSSIIKTVIFLVLASVAFAANFYYEQVNADNNVVVKPISGELDLYGENIIEDVGILRFKEEGDNQVEIKKISEGSILNVNSGSFWANLGTSRKDLNLWLTDKLVLIPNKATFDVEFDGERLILNVYSGDVLAGFWERERPDRLIDNYSDKFMNSLLIPQDTKVVVSISKINPELAPLLPSKLVKVFKSTAIPASEKDSKWLVENITKDNKYIEKKKQEIRSKAISRGVTSKEGVLHTTLNWLEKNFTFIPEKKREILLSNLFINIDNALYHATKTEVDALAESLYEFEKDLLLMPEEILKSKDFDLNMSKYLSDLSVFAPTDNEYQVLTFLLEKGLNDPFKLADFYWVNMYKTLRFGSVEASKAMDKFYKVYSTQISKEDPRYGQYISYLNQLFDNLFLRYPTFYRDAYFNIKYDLEIQLLALQNHSQLKTELSQSFVQSKIDFLKRLRRYFFNGEIDTVETKRIFKRLMSEAKGFLPKQEQTSVAVIQLFETQLNDINDFWGYLNTSEYHAEHYGKNHEERYKTYLQERKNIFSFVNIQQDVFGEIVEDSKSLEQVMEEIVAFFEAQDGVSDIVVGEIENSGQRYVKVNVVLAGYPFEGIFDRDTELLQEVYVYDQLISERAVNMRGLLILIQDRFTALASEEESTRSGDEVNIETIAQRTARLYVSELVSSFGFDVSIDDVAVFDAGNAIYRVERIHLAGYDKVLLTFDIMMNGEKVTHLFMAVSGVPRVIDGEFTLDELKLLAEAERNYIEHGVEYLLEDLLGDGEEGEDIVEEEPSEKKVLRR